MKQTTRFAFVAGWALFLLAIGLFCLQMGYIVFHERFQVEYVDDRIFYMINIVCAVFLGLSILLLLTISKRWQWIGASVFILFILVNGILLVVDNQETKNITSVSPDFRNVLSIKQDIESGEAIYYRTHYGMLARPRDWLPHETTGEFKVEWLADDIAAVTYKAADNTIQQFIGTYGDRGGGISYYNVGPEIHGTWQGDSVELISNTEGIAVTANGETESFAWDDIEQFGTLAVVLMRKSNEAAWTIGLNENFEIESDASVPQTGEIILYEATMEDNDPITLEYRGSY